MSTCESTITRFGSAGPPSGAYSLPRARSDRRRRRAEGASSGRRLLLRGATSRTASRSGIAEFSSRREHYSVNCFGWRRMASRGRRALTRVLAPALVLVAVSSWVSPALAATSPVASGSTANATSLSGADAVAVSGSYAYTTGYYAGTLTVADISNPASPQIVGQTVAANSLLDATNVAVSGSYAYV